MTDLTTTHKIIFDDAHNRHSNRESIDLIVTSPPYPMIEIWDKQLQFDTRNPGTSFLLAHTALSRVWRLCYDYLKQGGIICINIGDAVRTINGVFSLWPNAAKVTESLVAAGFQMLPGIIWRKPTNAPNKFMGSGMLPGAYVTLEHEHILIARKGGMRGYKTKAEKENRRRSAFFWEERNLWFSDVWSDLPGCSQKLGKEAGRERSGAFPFDLPYRLINMYSCYGDTVLDPFTGTGTTIQAAIEAGRNSIGIEIEEKLTIAIQKRMNIAMEDGLQTQASRIEGHVVYMAKYGKRGYDNRPHGVRVVTKQETELEILYPSSGKVGEDGASASYASRGLY